MNISIDLRFFMLLHTKKLVVLDPTHRIVNFTNEIFTIFR